MVLGVRRLACLRLKSLACRQRGGEIAGSSGKMGKTMSLLHGSDCPYNSATVEISAQRSPPKDLCFGDQAAFSGPSLSLRHNFKRDTGLVQE